MLTVKWGDNPVANCWYFEYIDSVFQPDGDHMPDVRHKEKNSNGEDARAGQLRHILQAQDLELDLRSRLYIDGCCSTRGVQ